MCLATGAEQSREAEPGRKDQRGRRRRRVSDWLLHDMHDP